jgi:hypothetical protein
MLQANNEFGKLLDESRLFPIDPVFEKMINLFLLLTYIAPF